MKRLTKIAMGVLCFVSCVARADVPRVIIDTDLGSSLGDILAIDFATRMGYTFTSSRLVGRSVWNTKWMLVIPATSINAKDQAKGLADFAKNVTDIKIGFKAYSRQGN